MESTDDEDSEEQDGMLPKLNEGEVVFHKEVNAVERFSKPKPRFTEASLVKRLEELGMVVLLHMLQQLQQYRIEVI